MHSNNKKNILVIGGEGFVGRNICNSLGTEHNVTSAGIVRSLFQYRKDKFFNINPYTEKVDLGFDVYIHLVDNSVSLDKYEIEEETLLKNLSMPINSHVIIFSSSAIYADPDSEYSHRKILLENIYKKYSKKNNLNLTILRLFNIYGHYQIPNRRGGLIANIFYNHIIGAPTEINDINASRDFIYASDMGNAILQAINESSYGEYDLSTGKLTSISNLIKILENNVLNSKINIIDKQYIEKKFTTISTSNYPIKRTLTPLVDGLKSTYTYFKDNEYIISQYLKTQ